MTVRWALALFLLAGCAASQDVTVARAECDRAVDNDPEVKRLMLVGRTDGGQRGYADALRISEYKARQACLRSKGLASSGGVDPVARGGAQLYGVK
jgi:hypothetical protein